MVSKTPGALITTAEEHVTSIVPIMGAAMVFPPETVAYNEKVYCPAVVAGNVICRQVVPGHVVSKVRSPKAVVSVKVYPVMRQAALVGAKVAKVKVVAVVPDDTKGVEKTLT